MIRITENEAATIVNALGAAAERYAEIAGELKRAQAPAPMVAQFEAQAREARWLADDLEQRGA